MHMDKKSKGNGSKYKILKDKKLPLYAAAIFVVVYLLRFIIAGNYEFVTYAIFVILAIALVAFTDKHFNYSSIGLWAFSIWTVLHMFGGSLDIKGTRLYDVMLFNIVGEPYLILKYDQVVHLFCYVVISMLLYSILNNYVKRMSLGPSVFLVLASTGVGAINEIIEFATVVFFHTAGVGGYENTALDLVFNFVGAIIGLLLSFRFDKNKRR